MYFSIRGRIRPCYISTSGQKSEQWVCYNMENGLQSRKLHFRADGQLIADMEVRTDGAFARRARDGEWDSEVEAKASFLCIAQTPSTDYDYVGLVLAACFDVEGCLGKSGNITNVTSEV